MASNTSFVLQIVGTVVGGYFGGTWGAYFGGLVGGAVGNLLDPQLAEGPRLGDLTIRSSTYGRTIPLIYGRENRVGGNIIWSNGIVETAHTTGHTWSGDKQTTYSYTASFAVALGQGEMRNLQALYANGKLIWSRADTIAAQAAATTRTQQIVDWCLDLPNASDAGVLPVCVSANEQLDFLTGYDADKLLPDFTPWVAIHPNSGSVTLSSDGGGEYAGIDAASLPGSEFSELEWFPGTADQPVSRIITGPCAACGPTPAYRGTAYFVIRRLSLARFGNQIPTIEAIVSGQREETVAEILDDVCERAGTSIDEVVPRGALSQMFVRGYAVAAARSAIAAIKPLMVAYPFDACDHGGVLRFTPRVRGPVATIALEDMGARTPDAARGPVFPIERIPDIEMPSEASVSYVDPDNGYQPGTQLAQRASGNAQTKLNESVPITMLGDEAKALAERLLWEGWLSRESIKPVTLSRRYDFLQPGDGIAVETVAGHTLYRILDLKRGDNGVLELALLRDDSLAYAGDSPGGEVFVYDQSPPVYDDTTPYLFNAPILASNEDNTGFHVALDSTSADWPLADLYRSTDGGFTWEFALRSNKRERIAYVNSIAGGPTEIWDRETVIEVGMLYPDAEAPESVSEEALLSSGTLNMIWVGTADGASGEVIQYSTAAQSTIGGALITFNEDYSNVAWELVAVSIQPRAVRSPSGGWADKIVEDTTTGAHFARRLTGSMPTLEPLTDYVWNGYAKAGERTHAGLLAADDEAFVKSHIYNLTDGSIYLDADVDVSLAASTRTVVLDQGIEGPDDDGWYRIWIKMRRSHPTPYALSLTLSATIAAVDMFNSYIYAGDGASGFYAWGMRVVAGTELEDYFVPGQFELSDLLRGRRGTEHAVGLHTTDDVAVFIPAESTESLDYGQADWNLERQYAAASIGQTAEDVMFIDFTATGERLKPRSPVQITGERDGSNNLTLEWIRRTRLFAPPMGYGDAPLGEASESYEVDIIVGGNVVRTITATTPTAAYSAANQTTDGITPGNPVTGNVYQISATYGRGWAGAFTV